MLFIHWNGWEENSRFFLTQVIVDEGKFQIDSFFNQTTDRAYFSGHYYSDKDPGLSFFAVGPYAIFEQVYNNFEYQKNHSSSSSFFTDNVGNNTKIYDILKLDNFTLYETIVVTIFTSVIFSSLTVVLIYKILGFYTKNEFNKILITFTSGFATTIFPNSLVFTDTAIGTFFALFGFYLILKFRKQKSKQKYLFYSGLCYGTALLISIFTFIAFALLIAYLLLSNKKNRLKIFFIFISGFLLSASIFLIYNFIIFGNPFTLPFLHDDSSIWGTYVIQSSRIFILSPYVIWRLLFDSYKGIFFYYPVLLFSIYGLYLMYKKMKYDSIFIASFFALLLLAVSRLEFWWSSGFFGPRYLSYAAPFLLLPSVFVLDNKNKILKVLFVIALLYSTFVNISGLQPPSNEVLLSQDKVGVDINFIPKIHSFEIIDNPIYNYYFPRLFQFGPRSRIIEDLIHGDPLDIRFLTPESREPFIPFSVGVNKEITFVSGWQYKRPNENVTWMIKDGQITIKNTVSDSNVSLSFVLGSYYEDKHLKIFVNQKLYDSIIVPKNHTIPYKIDELPYGNDEILFQTSETCKIPNFVEKLEDQRCLNIQINDLIVTINMEYKFDFGFYPKSASDVNVWMGQTGKIIVINNGPDVKKTIYLNLLPFDEDRTLNLTVNGHYTNTFNIVKSGGTVFTLPLLIKHGENVLDFIANEKCTKISEKLNNNDDRCVTFGFAELSER